MFRLLAEFIIFIILSLLMAFLLLHIWSFFVKSESTLSSVVSTVGQNLNISVNSSDTVYSRVYPYLTLLSLALIVFVASSAVGLFVYMRRR
ncbi:MAG: hypothetical protein QW726_06075 [Fervidicoccaceae archaeon]